MTRAVSCGAATGVDWQQRADVVVIGTGVAGLAAGLAAHRRGARTVILSKADETATFYAQGGIAVVLPFPRRDCAACMTLTNPWRAAMLCAIA